MVESVIIILVDLNFWLIIFFKKYKNFALNEAAKS